MRKFRFPGRSLGAAVAVSTLLSVGAARSGADLSEGYRRYNGGCNHCHGPDGAGSSFAPSLVDRPYDYDTFQRIVLEGRASGNSVMKGFAADPNVAPYVEAIYAYLKARSEGALARGRPPAPPAETR